MPVHDRSAMTFHLSRGKLIGSLDLTTPLEAERPVGCPSGHIVSNPIRGTFNHASTCSETQYGHHSRLPGPTIRWSSIELCIPGAETLGFDMIRTRAQASGTGRWNGPSRGPPPLGRQR